MSKFLDVFSTGANLVSVESAIYDQYDVALGPSPDTYPVHSAELLDWLAGNGVTCLRFLFTWEAMQPSRLATIPAAPGGNYFTYWQRYVGTVNALLERGIRVVCEPRQHNPASGDTDATYFGLAIKGSAFANFWARFSVSINQATGNDQRVAFGLLNEPHTHSESGNRPGDVGIQARTWFRCAQAAISAIRQAGVTNTILVPGMAYTDCATFVANGSAERFLKLVDSANNLAVSVHNYNGQLTTTGNRSTATALREAMADLVGWARANGVKVHVGEVALDAGAPNGTLEVAQAQWADWDAYCRENEDVVVGWCWWAVSEDAWWSTRDSSSGFNWGLTDGSDTSPSVYMNLIRPTLR